MASDRFQRRIDRLMDQIEEAADQRGWQRVRELANDVLLADAGNPDARNFLALAERTQSSFPTAPPQASTAATEAAPATHPKSFADGRYQAKRFLGEEGKKKVYLAHDTLLDREVAFALIKTEGLDETSRSRISREAQAMGRLGSHPHVVTVYDLGQHENQPYLVTELLGGGDVEGVIENDGDHRIPLERGQRASELARRLDYPHVEVAASFQVAQALAGIGQGQESHGLAQAMVSPAEKVHDARSMGSALWMNGTLSRSQGNWQDARGFLERSLEFEAGLPRSPSDLAVLDYQVGDLVHGEAHMDLLLEIVANWAIPPGGIT